MPTLAITELTLSHFRSHRLTRLSLDGRPVAIHGPNGAGKTNILEAISLMSPGRGLRRAAADDIARRREGVGWKISATLITPQQSYAIESRSEPNQPRQVRIDDKPSPQVALGRIARVLWLVPSMDRLWIEGADGRRRFLDRTAMSFEPGHAEAVLQYEKAMRERNRLLKDMVRDDHWYHALESQMAQAGAAITLNRQTALRRVAIAQKNAQTSFPAAEFELVHPRNQLPDNFQGLLDTFTESRGEDLRAGRTLVGPHRCDLEVNYKPKDIPAAQCSTGEQKALLISLVLSNARALADDTGIAPLILLDEIAAHLDADRRAALYDEICALGAQAWLTGTGRELFEHLGNRAQNLSVTETNGESEVTQCLE